MKTEIANEKEDILKTKLSAFQLAITQGLESGQSTELNMEEIISEAKEELDE